MVFLGSLPNYTVKSLIFAGICHIVSLQQSKICIFGRFVLENALNIFTFVGFIVAIMTPSRK
jgi:hypothetical protein